MNENEIGKKRGIVQTKLLALVLLVFGIVLVVCGIMSACWYSYIEGQSMPLFVGSFILGAVTLLEGCIYTCVFRKCPHTSDAIKKKEVTFLVDIQKLMLFALLVGSGMCIGFTISSKRLSRDEGDVHAAQNQVLAIVILASGVIMACVTIYAMYVMTIYGEYLKTSPNKPAPKPKQETSKTKQAPKPKQETVTTKPVQKPKQETSKVTTIAASSTSDSREIVNDELKKLKDQFTALNQLMEEQKESTQMQQQLNQQHQQQLQQQLQELKIQQQQLQQQFQYQSGSLPIPPPPSYMEVDPAPKDKTLP